MRQGVILALLAATLFGASTPFAKALVGDVHPIVLAGLLYAGSGVGLGVVHVLRLYVVRKGQAMSWPSRHDWGWLATAIITGGVFGPVLLMLGLATTPASTASLLLNLEGVFTALLAWFAFRENFDRRVAIGMAAIFGGAATLSIGPRYLSGISPGALLVAAACLCWGIDNNLTRKVAANDAIVIATLKGLVAAVVNLSVALALGFSVPSNGQVVQAATVGFFGYGVSLVLFVFALRDLGTARTGAYFSTAPFFGGLLSVAFFGDAVTLQLCIAAALMVLGVWLHLSEHHEHEHTHEIVEHTHRHRHDAHHQHVHEFEWDGSEPHAHAHRHEAIVHRHLHLPDLHHRHRH